jgi:uncharacterized lipoprotein YddW (UPF0748 family)
MQRLFILTWLALAPELLAADEKAAAEKIVPPPPLRELRAAWITEVVTNPDWPSAPGLPAAQQQAELIALIGRAAQLHFNALFFQVRPACDAVYSSPLEPWSDRLTGVMGRGPEPFYDPLALAIAEAHKRGLQLHAWFNPYRALHPSTKSPPAPNHLTRAQPELIRHYGDQVWVDPGEPAAQARVLAVVLDVVKRYDVDGVVFDDYFYPYPQKSFGRELDFPDDASWEKYGAKTGLTREDWRRNNVNQLVENVSREIKTAKPWVEFGISPFGIWRPQKSPPIAGLDAYEKIYADSRRWLADGWVDYLAPQLYWPVAASGQSFPVLLDWWRAQNVKGRHVWAALNDTSAGAKFTDQEIPLQVLITRGKNDPGAVHFHLRTILDHPALFNVVRAQYAQPALIPASPWLAATPPPPPKLVVDRLGKTAHVQWQPAAGQPAGWWVLQTRAGGVWTTQILPGGRMEAYLDNLVPDAVAIRAVDRLGNLSAPEIWTPVKYSPPPVKGGMPRAPK